jgi:Tol biopolymer transport system component
MSALGGEERRLAEVGAGRLSWSPDGKDIAFWDSNTLTEPWTIWALSLETLKKTQLTTLDTTHTGDAEPAFSPDGRYLAFVRRPEVARPALYIKRLPAGEPRLLTDYNSPVAPCWTADSREIVFGTQGGGDSGLWRIPAAGGVPRRIPSHGDQILLPSVSQHRLAYVDQSGNPDIWRVELAHQGNTTAPATPVISWTSGEGDPCISPDGARIAFASNSSGNPEIWVCQTDGTKGQKLTDMKAGSTGSPDWSPDGKWIAFDSTRSQNLDIYVVSADGGPVRPITTDATDEIIPRFSRDGRWIYFGSNRTGDWQIWKVPFHGGEPTRVTRNGGASARESVDGRFLYFSGYFERQNRGIWRIPVSGGSESLVLDTANDGLLFWDLTDRGIYFIDVSAKQASICFYDFGAQCTSSVAPLRRYPGFESALTISVSPDSKWLLVSGGILTSDIMVIENFR